MPEKKVKQQVLLLLDLGSGIRDGKKSGSGIKTSRISNTYCIQSNTTTANRPLASIS
jgi:hypothetical protein